jgi:hypothetical protein
MLCKQPAAGKLVLLLLLPKLLPQATMSLPPPRPHQVVGRRHQLRLTRDLRLLTPLRHRTHPGPLHHPILLPVESFLWADDEGVGATGAADSTSSRLNRPMATRTESSLWVEGEGIGVVGEVDSTSSNSRNHQMATTQNFSWAEEEADLAVDGEVEWDTNNRTKTAMVATAGRDADGRWNEALASV